MYRNVPRLRVAVGLLGGDSALIDEGLDEGVVLGDLGEFAVTQQVAAGVADMDHAEPVTGEQDRGEGGAHAVEVRIQFDLISDRRIALVNRIFQFAEQIAAGFVVIEMG